MNEMLYCWFAQGLNYYRISTINFCVRTLFKGLTILHERTSNLSKYKMRCIIKLTASCYYK